jgi:hypothetical protein
MSEIKVDTLTGKTTAGDITVTSEGGAATMQLQQGLAKAWQSITASGGTPSFNDSLNTSSITDRNVGRHTVNFSSSFSSVNYAVTGCCQTTGTTDLNDTGEFRVGDLTTGTEAFSTANEGQTVFVDCPRTHIHQLGDLA